MNATPKLPPVIRLAVYDGRERLGSIVEKGGTVEAFDVAGRRLGSFLTRKAAAAAIGALIHGGVGIRG